MSSVRWVFFGSQALHLVDVMEDEGVAPDVATWGTLMAAAKYLGQAEAAEMVRQLCEITRPRHLCCMSYACSAKSRLPLNC